MGLFHCNGIIIYVMTSAKHCLMRDRKLNQSWPYPKANAWTMYYKTDTQLLGHYFFFWRGNLILIHQSFHENLRDYLTRPIQNDKAISREKTGYKKIRKLDFRNGLNLVCINFFLSWPWGTHLEKTKWEVKSDGLLWLNFTHA